MSEVIDMEKTKTIDLVGDDTVKPGMTRTIVFSGLFLYSHNRAKWGVFGFQCELYREETLG